MFDVNGTVVVVFGSFAVYMVVMNKLFFAPMLRVTEERQSLINGAINTAQDVLTKQDALTKDCEAKLRQAREQAQQQLQGVVGEARTNADAVKASAREKALSQVQEQSQQLDKAATQWYETIKTQENEFATLISDKITAAGAKTKSLVS